MKRQILLFATVLLFSIQSHAQNVAINNDGSEPDPAAALDVKASDKGILIPRVDFNSLPDPPPSALLVYVTANGPDGNNAFYFYDGSQWQRLPVSAGLVSSQWTTSGSNIYYNTGNVGVGTTTPLKQLHLSQGDNPTIRLQQDGTLWPLYIWDITANEQNLFVKDYTNGSKIPVKVKSGSPTNSLVVSPVGVGIGGSLTINSNGTNTSYFFPETRGISGQVLSTDGSGGTNWATPSGSQWTTSGSNIYYNTGNVGIGNATPHAPLQFINTSASRKIVFYETADNDHQFFGFGTNSGILRYQLPSSTSNHVFYAGTSATESSEIFRIKGTGEIVIPALNTAGVLLNNTSGEVSTSIGTTGQVLTTDISGGISWATSAGGTVTEVGSTAPIVSSGGNAPVISILAATTSAAGSMSAADKTKIDGLVSSQWTTSGSDIYFNSGNVGIGNATPHAPLQFVNTSASRKIVFYETADNDHQFFGFGTNSGVLRYQLPSTTSDHVFYAGISATESSEIFRIKGAGEIVIPALNTAGVLLNNTSGEVSTSVGASGQVLTTDGSGGVSWANTTNLVTSVAGKTGAVTLNKGDVGLGNVENTALSLWPGGPAVVSVGTVTAGNWEAAPIDITHGGTGATDRAAAFDALSPMTDEGDILFGGAGGTGSRLEKGSAGQVLIMNDYESAPEWGNPAAYALVMTQTELLSIQNPSEGLMVYCTNCGSDGAHCIFTDDTWNYLFASSASQSPATPQFEEISYITNGLRWRWKAVPGADSYKWNTSNDYATAITTSPPILEHDQTGTECDRSYMCYVWAVDNGTGLVSAPLELYDWVEVPYVPEAGETELLTANQIDWKWHRVYNAIGYRFGISDDYSQSTDLGATDHKLETVPAQGIYTRYVWAYNSCGHSDALVLTFTQSVAAPVAAEPVWVSGTFFWRWNAVQDASGYKWNTNNDYNTATDLGDATETGESGLSCGTSYTRYVWAYNLWAHSDASALTAEPGPPETPENSGSSVGQTQITYNWTPVEGATGYKYSADSANYADATDIGNVTTLTRSGLACASTNELWVWAYNDCGHSGHLYILEMTAACSGNGPRRNI